MIVVDKTSKSYSEKATLQNISFHIAKGECVGLIGLNGAGKTTLINILLGKIKADSGLIRVLGCDSSSYNRDLMKKIGFVSGTETQLWKDMKIKYSFDNCAAMHNISVHDYKMRLKELCSALEISDILQIKPHQASLGQRMRCELAYALLPFPELLILDEATIGIDVAANDLILQYIDNLRRRNGMTVIYSDHSMNNVERLCDRIIVLHDKTILFDGDIRSFINLYGIFCKLKLKCDILPDLEDLPIEKFFVDNRSLTVEFNRQKISAAEIIRHIRQKCEIQDVKFIESNLENTVKKIYNSEV